jgi:ribonuclease E
VREPRRRARAAREEPAEPAAAVTVSEAAAEPAPQPEPEPAPVSAPAPEEPAEDTIVARVRARHEVTSAEPKLERVVVSPENGATEASGEAPVKRGWWQRRLGG